MLGLTLNLIIYEIILNQSNTLHIHTNKYNYLIEFAATLLNYFSIELK